MEIVVRRFIKRNFNSPTFYAKVDDPCMQLKKQNIGNAPELDSRRSSLNVFSCFFNRSFNELFIQLRGSFPLFITIYGKHFLLLFIERLEDFVFLSFFIDS